LLNEGSSPDADAARIVERRKRRILVDEGVELGKKRERGKGKGVSLGYCQGRQYIVDNAMDRVMKEMLSVYKK
jgi:hypothetical protein